MIKTLFLSIILFITPFLSAQLYETLESNAADLLISLSERNPNYTKEIEILKSNLFIDVNADELEKGYLTTATEFDSLKKHLNEFESEIKNIPTDSAYVLFNYWYLHFQNIFYEHSKEKFFSSQKTKIILFSTSMSCYCTLEMAKNQTIDLLNFIRTNNGTYDYWIIDSYWHNELQIEHLTLFAPSVIVFDENNEVLYKIEYEEKMLALLTDYLNNNEH